MKYDIGIKVEIETETFHFIDEAEIEGLEGTDVADVKLEIAKTIRDTMESRDALVFMNELKNPVILQVKDIKSVEVFCDELEGIDWRRYLRV